MKSGGELQPHIHSAGWLSGSIYINIPPKSKTDSGNLVIIYNAYKLAEWSLEKWPGWFKESKEVNENSDTY